MSVVHRVISSIKICPKIFETSIFFKDIFQNQFHRSWVKIFLLPLYFLMVALLEVQLQVILVEIRWKEVQRNYLFNSCSQIWTKVPKLEGKLKKCNKYFFQNTCPKLSKISIFLSKSNVRNLNVRNITVQNLWQLM